MFSANFPDFLYLTELTNFNSKITRFLLYTGHALLNQVKFDLSWPVCTFANDLKPGKFDYFIKFDSNSFGSLRKMLIFLDDILRFEGNH